MDKTTDILPECSIESAFQPTSDPREDEYGYALERVLAYLKALRVPEEKAADYAAEAVRMAGQAQSMHLVAAAMQALWVVLRKDQNALGDVAQQIFSHTASDGAGQIASMPPLNRDSMLAVELDRKPWWTFFTKYVLRK